MRNRMTPVYMHRSCQQMRAEKTEIPEKNDY